MGVFRFFNNAVLLVFHVLFFSFCINAQEVNQQNSDSSTGPHIQVQLISEYQQLSVGQNWLGVLLQPDPMWHTYWRNPGDSGEAPTIEWSLPAGISNGEIQWPIPKLIKVAHLVNYGFEGSVLLMVPINISSDYSQSHSDLMLQVDLSWLVCKEDCIPGWATLSKQFVINDSPSPSSFQNIFTDTRERLPNKKQLTAKYEITQQHIIVALTTPSDSEWQLLPFDSDIIQHNAVQQLVENDKGVSLVLEKSNYFSQSDDDSNRNLEFLLTNGEIGYYVNSQLLRS